MPLLISISHSISGHGGRRGRGCSWGKEDDDRIDGDEEAEITATRLSLSLLSAPPRMSTTSSAVDTLDVNVDKESMQQGQVLLISPYECSVVVSCGTYPYICTGRYLYHAHLFSSFLESHTYLRIYIYILDLLILHDLYDLLMFCLSLKPEVRTYYRHACSLSDVQIKSSADLIYSSHVSVKL